MVHGGFDGFRFDLADRARPPRRTASTRTRRSSRRSPPIPSSPRRELIAEPWDIGPGGYQLGRFGPALGRMERPLPRRRAPLLARRRRTARRTRDPDRRLARHLRSTPPAPSKSVNFIVAHDGFTLADLVSYAHKHNEANGENNRDGTDNNLAGTTASRARPTIRRSSQRARATSAICSTLLLASRGTPMLVDGHRSSASARAATTTPTPRTTRSSAIDWAPPTLRSSPSPPGSSRLARSNPALSRDAFLTGAPFDATGLADVEWRDADGPMTQSGWSDPAGRGSGCGLRRAARATASIALRSR